MSVPNMKTQMGVGLAVLSVLAAEGKDFSREELNAMLADCPRSPHGRARCPRDWSTTEARLA